jgi:type VI protein secretion system component Hcp
MSETKNSDVLAYFQRQGDPKPIPAEALSDLVDSTDTLVKDFRPGHFFTADTFSFGAVLADDEGENIVDPREARSYGRWRALKVSEPKPNPPFRTEPEDVSITRMIDSSSPLLLSHCLETQPFSTAVIVKRSRNGTSGLLSAILRLEFSTVWIKAVEWEDGDAIVETIKFKFNAVKATYVRRKPDGTIASTWPCAWTNPLIAGGANG